MASAIPRPRLSRRTSSSPDSHTLKMRAAEVQPPSPSKLHRSNSSPPKMTQAARLAATSSRVRTFLRVRPTPGTPSTWLKRRPLKSGKVFIDVDHPKLSERKPFVVDGVLGESSTQAEVFNAVGVASVEHFLAGYNNTIFAYGTSGSGKSHTMHGELDRTTDDRGLTIRILDYLFARLQQTDFKCTCAFVDIYHEKLYDLLDGRGCDPKTLRENTACHQVYVQNLVEKRVESAADAFAWLDTGCKTRRAASNRDSSRSHTVFTLRLTQTRPAAGGATKVVTSVLHCVDLAGSERPASTMHRPVKDVTQINKSLSSLATVILALGDMSRGKRHVPYRDCKLTFLLREALGGNSKTTVVATVLADDKGIAETLATLQFVDRVKHVTTVVSPNEFVDNGGDTDDLPSHEDDDAESAWPSSALVHPMAPVIRLNESGGHIVLSTGLNEPVEVAKRDSWTQKSPNKTVLYARPFTRRLDVAENEVAPVHPSGGNLCDDSMSQEPLNDKATVDSTDSCALGGGEMTGELVSCEEEVSPVTAPTVDCEPVVERSVCEPSPDKNLPRADTPAAEAPTKRDSSTQDDELGYSSHPSHQLPAHLPCAQVLPLQPSVDHPPRSSETPPNRSTSSHNPHDPFVTVETTYDNVPYQPLSIGACLVALQSRHDRSLSTDRPPQQPPNDTTQDVPSSPVEEEPVQAKRDSWTQSDEPLHDPATNCNGNAGSSPGGGAGVALFVVGLCLGGCTVCMLVYLRQRR